MYRTIAIVAALVASSLFAGERLSTKELNLRLNKIDAKVEDYKDDLLADLATWTSGTEGISFPALLYIGANDPQCVAAIRDFFSRSSQGEMSDAISWVKVSGAPESLKLLRVIADGSLNTEHLKENREEMRNLARGQALAALAFHQQPELLVLIKQFLESQKWELRLGALEAAFWLKLTDDQTVSAAKAIIAAPPGKPWKSAERDAVIWCHAILARMTDYKAASLAKLKDISIALTTAEMDGSLTATTALSALPADPQIANDFESAALKSINPQLTIRFCAVLACWDKNRPKQLIEIKKLVGDTTQAGAYDMLYWCGYSVDLLKDLKPEIEAISKTNRFWFMRWHAGMLLKKDGLK
jgi:hypothetical protein